jgi:hypothetical protein
LFPPLRERKETKNHLVVMACLERKYEDPIFPTHKIRGPECSEFPNEDPERKSIKRNIEKERKEKKTKMVGKRVGEIF